MISVHCVLENVSVWVSHSNGLSDAGRGLSHQEGQPERAGKKTAQGTVGLQYRQEFGFLTFEPHGLKCIRNRQPHMGKSSLEPYSGKLNLFLSYS